MLWFGALLVVIAGICQGIATIYGTPVEDRQQFRDNVNRLSLNIENNLSSQLSPI
jgi:hypothetical protein